MPEQMKDLCLFMICGQTLLYFQSGKKYEKICRMILELLILAGIVGMLLNFLQSLGLRKGEMEAAGGAVAGMQRSMEEALSKQLGAEGIKEGLLEENVLGNLVEKYTIQEIKTRYNYFAQQYGYEIQEIKQYGDKLQVFLKESGSGENLYVGQGESGQKEVDHAGNPAKIVGIEQIEIGEIALGEGEETAAKEEEDTGRSETSKEELERFRRQLALVFAMEEKSLEVILID